MKISAITNRPSLNYTQSDLNFYQQNLLENIAPPDSFETIQTLEEGFNQDNSPKQRRRIFQKIGKIFEDACAFQTARLFYEKAKQEIPAARTKNHQDLEFDIKRVIEKDYKQSSMEQEQEVWQ